MKYLSVRVPKSNEFTYEKALAFFSSVAFGAKKKTLLDFLKPQETLSYSFNILSAKQQISFIIVVKDDDVPSITNQILAQYTSAQVKEIQPFRFRTQFFYELVPSKSELLPIKTSDKFRDVDPLASILSSISRTQDPNSIFWLQIIATPTDGSWQSSALRHIDVLGKTEQGVQQTQTNRNQIQQIQEKTRFQGFKVNIRLLSNTKMNLNLFYSSFSILAGEAGNILAAKEPGIFSKEKLLEACNTHKPSRNSFILNTNELSTIWHLPNKNVNIPNIVWGKKLNLEAPANLPVNEKWMDEVQRADLTLFGKTEYKNKDQIFGIKRVDRLKHMYIIGKTGTGKTTLLENMIIDDIRKGYGVAYMDPHGDAAQKILQYVPKKRINDVCYFNPADAFFAFPLNILEIPNPSQRELMVSGHLEKIIDASRRNFGKKIIVGNT